MEQSQNTNDAAGGQSRLTERLGVCAKCGRDITKTFACAEKPCLQEFSAYGASFAMEWDARIKPNDVIQGPRSGPAGMWS